MRKEINDEIIEGTFGRMRQVEDFLPEPDELVFKKPIRKVTIALDQESIDFFKAEAERLNVPYQRMIRVLLLSYVERAKHHQAPTPS